MTALELTTRLLEDEETDPKELLSGALRGYISLQDYWDGAIPGRGTGNPWDRPILMGAPILNGKIADSVKRRNDGMFAVVYGLRDGRKLHVICPPGTQIKVRGGNDLRPRDVLNAPSFAPPRDPYQPLRSDDPGYVITIPLSRFW